MPQQVPNQQPKFFIGDHPWNGAPGEIQPVPPEMLDPLMALAVVQAAGVVKNPEEGGEEKPKGTLILIRGVPGSGKSTLAKILSTGYRHTHGLRAAHYEADMYFEKDNGAYEFVPEKLPEAHQWCLGAIEDLMRKGQPNIIVSNTFVYKAHMEPYRKIARRYNYRIWEIICHSSFKNIHDVPADKVRRLQQNFEY